MYSRYCRFSPDGLKLASGGKDKYVNIFDFDPESMTLKFSRSLDRYSHSVAFFAWSPDSTKLAVCGPEDCDEVRTEKGRSLHFARTKASSRLQKLHFLFIATKDARQQYTLQDFRENMDNFEARTERVNFGLFQSNSAFT